MLSATWERIVQDTHFGSVHFERVSWGLLHAPECPWDSHRDGMMFWCSVLNCSFWNSYFQLFRFKSLAECPDDNTTPTHFRPRKWFGKWRLQNKSTTRSLIFCIRFHFQEIIGWKGFQRFLGNQISKVLQFRLQSIAKHAWSHREKSNITKTKVTVVLPTRYIPSSFRLCI